MRRQLPSPALVVASVALVVALTGTAIAANVVPLAARAKVADNAKKLGGKTPVPVLVLTVGLKQAQVTLDQKPR